MATPADIRSRSQRAYGRAVSATYRDMFSNIADRRHSIAGDNTRGKAIRSQTQRNARRAEKCLDFMTVVMALGVSVKFGRI